MRNDTLHLAAEAAAELEYRRCRREPRYFVEEYIYIQDPASPTGVIRFSLWPDQKTVLETFVRERLVVVLKARQLGLTWLALSYALWRCLFQAGYSVVCLSKTDDDAKELIRRVRFILERLPRWLAREDGRDAANFAGPRWTATTHEVAVRHGPGEAESRMKALPASQDAGRSLTGSLVLIDEWAFQEWAYDIWQAAFPTVNRPGAGQVIGISTGRAGTLFQEIWDGATAGKNGFVPVFLPWTADPRRDATWYEATKAAMLSRGRSEAVVQAEYPATPQEAFSSPTGRVFWAYDERVHLVDPFAPLLRDESGWRFYESIDPGVRVTSYHLYALSPDGVGYALEEVVMESATPAMVADEIRRARARQGNPQIEYTLIDPAAEARTGPKLQTTRGEYHQNGIWTTLANNDMSGIYRINDALRNRRLFVTRNCAELARQLASNQFRGGKPEDKDNHSTDELRYWVNSRPELTGEGGFLPGYSPRSRGDVTTEMFDRAEDWDAEDPDDAGGRAHFYRY